MPRRKGRLAPPVTKTRVHFGEGMFITVDAVEWCDCSRPEMGFVKRDDGAWVKPCCRRRTFATWMKWGNGPVPPDPEQIARLEKARSWRGRASQ